MISPPLAKNRQTHHIALREVGSGRFARQPGQAWKGAALTRPLWVARPASHL